jgi:hypothetical protein
MMKKVLVSIAIAVVLIALGSSSAIASIQAVDPDAGVLVGQSWGWDLVEDGYFDNIRYPIDSVKVTWVSGSHLENYSEGVYLGTFRELSNNWTNGAFTNTYSIAVGPKLVGDSLFFQVWFEGNFDSTTRIFYSAMCGGKVVGQGSGYATPTGGFSYIPSSQGGDLPEPASFVVWCLLGAGSWFGLNSWRKRTA